jgi:hypothetical protein
MLPRLITSSWFTTLPNSYARIGISRSVPRNQSGYRVYSKLAPGSWFNSVSSEEYVERYFTEILQPLRPEAVLKEIEALCPGKIPALLCFEPSTPGPQWCHRALVSAWFSTHLGIEVPEFGLEGAGSGWHHPKWAPELRHGAARQIVAKVGLDCRASPPANCRFRRP